jgi:hypothetical protein
VREIRGVDQRDPQRVKRWFQDDYFDLYVWQDRAGEPRRFQLCYERDTRRERALEWQHGIGFQHLTVRQRYGGSPGRDHSGDMALDGVLPYVALQDRFAAAAQNLPPELRRFIEEKLTEYARPARRFRRPSLPVPRWLARLRERETRRSPKKRPV